MAETSYIIQNGRRLDLKDASARKSIGSCDELQTETKHCLVYAINELCEKVGEGGGGDGDMLASVYDPQGKQTDIFAYAAPASHKHSYSDVGAAPDGFGLGSNTFRTAPSLDGISYNADACVQNGWWAARGNTPNNSWWMLHVSSYSENNVYQEAYGVLSGGGVKNSITARRVKESGVWQPWEYVNPPLANGVEYRTTERLNGATVYAKLVSIGALPNNGTAVIAIAENIRYLLSVYGLDLNTGQIIPSTSWGGNVGRDVGISAGRSGVIITTNFDASGANQAYIIAKYTKTTD